MAKQKEPKHQNPQSDSSPDERLSRESSKKSSHEQRPSQNQSRISKILSRTRDIGNRLKNTILNTGWWDQQRLLVLFNGILAVFTILLWYTATEQWNITRETLVASQRPWVAMPMPEILNPLSFDSKGASVRIRWQLKNAGNSPALNAVPFFQLLIAPSQSPTQHSSSCHPAFLEMTQKVATIGHLILPSSASIETEFDIFTPRSHFKLHNGRKDTNAYIGTCISYRDQFNITHITEMSWQYVTGDRHGNFEPTGTHHGFLRPGIGQKAN
jgi:hypothetical protein